MGSRWARLPVPVPPPPRAVRWAWPVGVRVAVDAGDACGLVLVFLFGPHASWENITNRVEALDFLKKKVCKFHPHETRTEF